MYKKKEIIMMSGSDAIKRVRNELNLEQLDFAKKVNVSKTAIYNYEMGTRKPRPAIAFRIRDFAKSQGVDVSIEELLTD